MTQELQKINESSSISVYRVKSSQTVHDVLKKLNLESRYFAVLVNGKKADLSLVVDQKDEIVVLPKIAGG